MMLSTRGWVLLTLEIGVEASSLHHGHLQEFGPTIEPIFSFAVFQLLANSKLMVRFESFTLIPRGRRNILRAATNDEQRTFRRFGLPLSIAVDQ